MDIIDRYRLIGCEAAVVVTARTCLGAYTSCSKAFIMLFVGARYCYAVGVVYDKCYKNG